MQVGSDRVGLTPEQEAMARAGWKTLIPIGGRPFLAHLLDQLRAGGIREVCVVVGPGDHPVRRYLEAFPPAFASVSIAVQEVPSGTGHALHCARDFLLDGPAVVVNGDNIYPAAVIQAVRSIPGTGLAGFRSSELLAWSGEPRSRITAYALLQVDERGHLVGIAEKPSWDLVQEMGPDPLVSMNCWRFTPRIVEVLAGVGWSARGERELPDAVRQLVSRGEVVHVIPVATAVPDLTTVDDVPRVAAYLSGCAVP
jgi:glucose-1-phosphate thymidylyltransferase